MYSTFITRCGSPCWASPSPPISPRPGAGIVQQPPIDLLYPIFYTELMKVILTTERFDEWLASLRDRRAYQRIQVRIARAEDGNFGDCCPVGEGVSEMRIHYGPGYRVYFAQRGMEIVVLLAGGDKATQKQDIKDALALARQL